MQIEAFPVGTGGMTLWIRGSDRPCALTRAAGETMRPYRTVLRSAPDRQGISYAHSQVEKQLAE